MKVRQARASITIHEGVGNRMIPALVPVPHHHVLRHQPDKLTERWSPGGRDDTTAIRMQLFAHVNLYRNRPHL